MKLVNFTLLATISIALSGCFFFYVPGSVTGGVSDAITGAEGSNCVGAGAKVGDKVRLPGGGVGTIKSLSGTSVRCTNPELPIRALLEFDADTGASQTRNSAPSQTVSSYKFVEEGGACSYDLQCSGTAMSCVAGKCQLKVSGSNPQPKTTPSPQTSNNTGTSNAETSRKIDDMWKAKDFSGLIKMGEELSIAQPGNYLGWYTLGIGYWGSGEVGKSKVAFDELLRLRPDFIDTLGKIYQMRGDNERLENIYAVLFTIDESKAASFKSKYMVLK